MTTLDLPRQSGSELASLIDAADNEQLHHLSSALAHAVVEHSGLAHPLITEALQHLSVSTAPCPELRARVQAFAEQLDEHYFDLKQPYEGREDAGKADAQSQVGEPFRPWPEYQFKSGRPF